MRNLRSAWNKGRLLGQKPPLKPKEIWSLRIRLQLAVKPRELALFNLAIDSKLRGCDLVSLRLRDVYQGSVAASRAIVMRRKTQRPVQLENAASHVQRLQTDPPAGAIESEILKMHPVPGTSSTLRAPPSASIPCRAIDRPSPSPVLSSLPCVNGRNIFLSKSSGRPPQWSATSIQTCVRVPFA